RSRRFDRQALRSGARGRDRRDARRSRRAGERHDRGDRLADRHVEGHRGEAGTGRHAQKSRMSYVAFGIDLGTTNSCVASADGTDVRVFPNNDQMSVTPSVVRILKTGRLVVGKRAYNAISEDPDNIALEFKRWMGQKHERAFPAASRTLTAEDLSAEILKSLAEDVKRQTGNDLKASVVTVPAAFGALQCESTARAAQLAGFEQAPLLQEPIAAAIAYGADPKGGKNQRWMVFDLGGGTLDIAVVSTKDGRLNVLEHRGNNLLGGKDIDRKIVEAVLLPILADTY